ncbi:MAG: 2-C-methyl-D-erythritol 4-phosphate cytidylyltransferase [Flavobacteriales bacterium]
MNRWAVIVAGGRGERMKAAVPKQFIPLAGKPLLMHTMEAFHSVEKDIQIILVLPSEHIDAWSARCAAHHFNIPHITASGGATRFHSTCAGMEAVQGHGVVAVHDGVRCLISPGLINRCYTEAEEHGNAVPCVPLKDSIRQVAEDGNRQADRDAFAAIQTPQCFKTEILKKALEQDYSEEYTDEASCVERLGHSIHLIPGEVRNIKITTEEDLLFAQACLESKG